MVYRAIKHNFKDFLKDIFIGEKINILYFSDDEKNIIVSNEKIYPIICKKYNILFPHDFNSIDEMTVNNVKINI